MADFDVSDVEDRCRRGSRKKSSDLIEMRSHAHTRIFSCLAPLFFHARLFELRLSCVALVYSTSRIMFETIEVRRPLSLYHKYIFKKDSPFFSSKNQVIEFIEQNHKIFYLY